MSATIIGATGPIGAGIVKHLLTSSVTNITSIGRREPLTSSDKIECRLEPDPKKWGQLVPKSDVFINAFGLNTPSYSAKEYHDLELGTVTNVATACKKMGVKNFILFTTEGVSETSRVQVFKTKAAEEKVVSEMGFDRVVIVRPLVVTGKRDVPKNFLTTLVVKYSEWTRGTIFGLSAWSGDEFGLATKNIVEDILADKFPKGKTVIGAKELGQYLGQ